MGNYTNFKMFENPRRGRQERNFTTNVPKILDLKSGHYPTNRRSEKGSFTMTTGCPRAPRGKKKQQTDSHGEDMKKSNISYE